MVRFVDDMEANRVAGPVTIAREVHDVVQSGESEEVSARLASVKVEHNQFGGVQFEIQFHQKQVQSEFTFNAMVAERDPIGDATSKATNIQELSEDIGTLANIIKMAYDTNPWEFAELNAASISGSGALTDYGFVYETGAIEDSYTDEDLERAIRRL